MSGVPNPTASAAAPAAAAATATPSSGAGATAAGGTAASGAKSGGGGASKGGGTGKTTATKASGAGTTAKPKKKTNRKRTTTATQKKNNEANSQALWNAARSAQMDLAQHRAQTVARMSDPLWYRIEDILPATRYDTAAAAAAAITAPGATGGGGILPEQLQIVEAALGNNHMSRGDVTPQGMACLLEQARRYAQEILDDAMDYATHANRMDISRNDILLAAEMRNDYLPSGNIITGASMNSNTTDGNDTTTTTTTLGTTTTTTTTPATATTSGAATPAANDTTSTAPKETTTTTTSANALTTSTSTLLSSNNTLALLPKLSLLADQMNRSPLPPIPTHCYSGIVLPPRKHSLTARTYDIVSGAHVATKMIQYPPKAPTKPTGAVPMITSSSGSNKPGYGATRGSQIKIQLKGSEGTDGNAPIQPTSS